MKKIFVLFGVPGSGKSFIACKLAAQFKAHFYDADDDYTFEMMEESKKSEVRKILVNKKFYYKVIENIKRLLESNNLIFVATSLGTSENREQFINAFGDKVQFILINPDKSKHLEMVLAREFKDPDNKRTRKELKNFLKQHLKKKRQSFDKPRFSCFEIENGYTDATIEKAVKLVRPALDLPD